MANSALYHLLLELEKLAIEVEMKDMVVKFQVESPQKRIFKTRVR